MMTEEQAYWAYAILVACAVLTATYVIVGTDDDPIGRADEPWVNRMRRVGFFALKAGLVCSAVSQSWLIKAMLPLAMGLVVLIINAVAIRRRFVRGIVQVVRRSAQQ